MLSKCERCATNDNEQISSTDSNRLLLGVQRTKIEFNLKKPLKHKLNENNAFDKATTPTTTNNNNITVVRSKLSLLLKTALNSRTNNRNVQEQAVETSPPSKENFICNAKVSKEPNSIDLLIDDDIIRKVTSQPITEMGNASSSESPKNDPSSFEFDEIPLDSAKQFVDDKCVLDKGETETLKSSSLQITSTNQSKAETPQRTYSQTNTQQNASTALIKNRMQMAHTNSNLPTTSIPIPPTKLPPNPFRTPALRNPFRTPALPNPFRTPALSKNNTLKPNKINIPINQRRSTVDPGRKPLPVKRGTPITPYQPSIGLWNFKIPKISKTVDSSTSMSNNTTTTNKSIPSASINKSTTTTNKSILSTATKTSIVSSTSNEPNPSINEPYQQATVETTNVIEIDDDITNTSVSNSNEDAINQHTNTNSTANENILDEKIPSQKETSMAVIKELMNSNQFATLIEIMGQIVTLKKDANKEGGSSSPFGNTITETIPTSLKRSRSLSPTPSCFETSLEVRESDVMGRPTFKNIDPQWHSLKKVLKCHVCYKPHGISLVSHYVNKHPDSEVLISRLPPEAADSLRSGNGVTKCKVVREKGASYYEYEQFCYFCNVHRRMVRTQWIAHLSRHTGYYPWKCNHCSRMFAEKPTHKCSKQKDLSMVTQPQYKDKVIKAYVCNLCNYVRLHQQDIERHLKVEHEVNSTNFLITPFLSFPVVKGKYRKNKTSSVVDDFLENFSDSEIKEENDSRNECKTEDFDSEYESDAESDWDIKDELQDEDDIDKDAFSSTDAFSD